MVKEAQRHEMNDMGNLSPAQTEEVTVNNLTASFLIEVITAKAEWLSPQDGEKVFNLSRSLLSPSYLGFSLGRIFDLTFEQVLNLLTLPQLEAVEEYALNKPNRA